MSTSPIEEIKNRLDIVDVIGSYIKLQKVGANYRARCPFHSEKKPSFFVSPARQIWHCFGACSEGGDIFKFVMKIEGVEFGDALKILAQKAGVELKKERPELKTARRRLYEICELATLFFEKQLEESSTGKKAKEYLLSRGINEESIKKWRLGYAPESWRGLSDFLVSRGYRREEIIRAGLALKSEKGGDSYDRFRGRIIFPIFNLASQVIGFGGRIFEKSADSKNEVAKYINSPATLLYDKSRILYGLNNAGLEARKKDACILVEGYVDAIMVSQAGFKNVVATSGTALTPHQLKILKRYTDNLLTAFDMDVAGSSATKRGIDLAQSFGFNIKVITMPKDSDPADIVAKDPEVWKGLVEKAKTIHDFYFELVLSKFDKNTIEGKKKISQVLLPVIKRIPNKIEQNCWIQDLAQVLGVREEDILEELQKTKIENPEIYIEEKTNGGDKEITNPLNKKSRKELLEEYLVSLTIKFPKTLELISKEDLSFFSSRFSTIINHFKNKGFVISPDLPEELVQTLNPLFIKAEIMEIEPGFKEEVEFKQCLKELKAMEVKNRLDKIAKKIKEAEREKNFDEIKKLTEQFNTYSKLRSKLETA